MHYSSYISAARPKVVSFNMQMALDLPKLLKNLRKLFLFRTIFSCN
jgi:hypothetical protein